MGPGLSYLMLGAGVCVVLVVWTIVWCVLAVGKRADKQGDRERE